MHFVNPEDLPPELRAHLEQHMMVTEQNAHDVRDLFESLDESQLRVFRGILRIVDENPGAASYYAGVVSTQLSFRFGVCLGCGRKHDEELKDMATESGVPKTWTDIAATLDTETLENLHKYHLNVIPNEWPRVVCAKCGKTYVSLEDRMLREPDDCSGCHEKEMWG